MSFLVTHLADTGASRMQTTYKQHTDTTTGLTIIRFKNGVIYNYYITGATTSDIVNGLNITLANTNVFPELAYYKAGRTSAFVLENSSQVTIPALLEIATNNIILTPLNDIATGTVLINQPITLILDPNAVEEVI